MPLSVAEGVHNVSTPFLFLFRKSSQKTIKGLQVLTKAVPQLSSRLTKYIRKTHYFVGGRGVFPSP